MTEHSVIDVRQRILSVRGNQVILDQDLAEFFHTDTRRMNQTVKRNQNRFPIEFVFQLSEEEAAFAWQVIRRKDEHGGRRSLPLGFTQEGVAILSVVMKGSRAAQINDLMMKAFFQSRRMSGGHLNGDNHLNEIIQNQTEQMKLLQAIYAATLSKRYGPEDLAEAIRGSQGHLVQLPPETIDNQSGRPTATVLQNTLHRRVEAIQKAVADYYGLSIREIKSKSRIKTVALPRQIAIYLIRKQTDLGFKEIGSLFGGKDHTTILHGYRKISTELKNNPSIREAVEAIEATLTH